MTTIERDTDTDTDTEEAPRLTVRGSDLIKPNGNAIWLRGENWGQWGKALEGDAADAKARGCNVIRLPILRWWGLYNRPDIESRDDKGYAAIRKANIERSLTEIAWIVKAQLWIVPFNDSDCGQNGAQTPEERAYCDPYGAFGPQGRNFWSDLPSRSIYKNVWKVAAGFLRTVPRVAMYEVTPEPLHGHGAEWAGPIRDYYRDVIAAIDEVDDRTPKLIGARSYGAKACDEAYLSERDDIVYTGNFLSGTVTDRKKFDEALAALVAMREERNVPIFCQQVGRKSIDDPTLEHMRYALGQLNAHRMHWTWWNRRQGSTSPDGYGLQYEDGEGGWITKQDEMDCLSEFLRASQ